MDQQLTIEKFRLLVHQLQVEAAELREKGEQVESREPVSPSMMSLSVQMRSTAMKSHSRVGGACVCVRTCVHVCVRACVHWLLP